MLLSTYSDNNDFITSEMNGSVGVVIILHLNAFEQSAILNAIICHMQDLYSNNPMFGPVVLEIACGIFRNKTSAFHSNLHVQYKSKEK